MDVANSLLPAPGLQAAWGQYTVPGKGPQPAVITGIKLYGWSYSPPGRPGETGRWLPIDGVRLDPSRTNFAGFCSCPVAWQGFASQGPPPVKTWLA